MMWVMPGGSKNNQTKHLTLNDNKGKVLVYFVVFKTLFPMAYKALGVG